LRRSRRRTSSRAASGRNTSRRVYCRVVAQAVTATAIIIRLQYRKGKRQIRLPDAKVKVFVGVTCAHTQASECICRVSEIVDWEAGGRTSPADVARVFDREAEAGPAHVVALLREGAQPLRGLPGTARVL
jgi:hypothetical protein